MTSWSVAALLVERRRMPAPQPLDAAAQALAAQRLARWQQQPPFNDSAWFLRRLQSLGCSVDQFATLLGEPVEAAEARLPLQPWLHWHPALDDQPHVHTNHRFASLLAPWLAQAEQRLVPLLAPLPKRDQLGVDLLNQLCKLLSRCVERSVALELQIARTKRSFEGNTGAERFAAFLTFLSEGSQRQALLADYPCLAQQLAVQTKQWIQGLGELVQRLHNDQDRLTSTYQVSLDQLTRIETGLGDTHAGGRSVARLMFEDGSGIAYKPRPQGIAAWFQATLQWLNHHGWQPAFQPLKILARDTYGWLEWLSPTPCPDESAVARFYTRLGGLLGLLSVIQATDMHLENILAVGEHPCVLDHETLFHPSLPLPEATNAANWVLTERYRQSVLRCGLLPQRLDTIPDLSGIGGQRATQIGEVWADYHTEDMRIVIGEQRFAVGANQPQQLNERIEPLRHWNALETGCTEILRLLRDHRDAFTEQMRQASALQTRCVVRPSQVYAHLRGQSWHPSVLVRGLERQLILDRLWIAAPRWPWISDLIHAEQADLAQGDIPYFSSRPASRRLWSSRGAPLRATYQQSALEAAGALLANLDDEAIGTQRALIRESAVVLTRDWQPPMGESQPRTPIRLRTNQRYASAIRLGHQLATSVVSTPFGTLWNGPQRRADGLFNTGPLTADLGDGITGVLLFLAALYQHTKQRRWARLVADALPALESQLTNSSSRTGLWWGVGGSILGLLNIATWMNDPTIAALAVRSAPTESKAAEPWLGAGLAGLAMAWLELWHHTQDSRWLEAFKRAIPMLEAGLEQAGDLLGGAAGCAWVLYRSADRLGHPKPPHCDTQADLWATLALWQWQPQPDLLQTQINQLIITSSEAARDQGQWQALMWAARVAKRRDWLRLAHQRRAAWYRASQAGQRCNTPLDVPAAGLMSGWAGNGWAILNPLPPLVALCQR